MFDAIGGREGRQVSGKVAVKVRAGERSSCEQDSRAQGLRVQRWTATKMRAFLVGHLVGHVCPSRVKFTCLCDERQGERARVNTRKGWPRCASPCHRGPGAASLFWSPPAGARKDQTSFITTAHSLSYAIAPHYQTRSLAARRSCAAGRRQPAAASRGSLAAR